MRTISDQLREVIASRRLSGYELGELAGLDRSIVSRFLAGRSATTATIDRLADVLGLRLVETATRRRSTARDARNGRLGGSLDHRGRNGEHAEERADRGVAVPPVGEQSIVLALEPERELGSIDIAEEPELLAVGEIQPAVSIEL